MSESEAPQSDTTTPDESLDGLRAELEEARSRASTYLDLAQRSQADFANYKRRTDQERQADGQRARAGAISDLLPLLDDLERAVGHLPEDLRDHPWAKGVALLAGRLESTLAKLGVEKVGQVGEPFDPNVHEAVHSEPRAGVEPGHVAEIFRHGYRTSERLLRPAQVVVGAEGEPAQPAGDGADAGEQRARIDERA
jgi:molecular chaperone GrpE